MFKARDGKQVKKGERVWMNNWEVKNEADFLTVVLAIAEVIGSHEGGSRSEVI